MEKIIQSVSKSSRGYQIYIPKKDAEKLGIKAGDMLEFQLIKIIKWTRKQNKNEKRKENNVL